MTAYYNELDPQAAQWLRNLIAAGHIAPGVVDERSIEDVSPDELANYTQCHFFAGVGVWSLALRNAGWPDDKPIWTGSCPCQPFSAAGKGAGFADERHLWPAFYWLIKQCRPAALFGEQVASKAVEPWIDLVQVDLEALGYAFGCVPFPSAGVGAPMLRDRAFWVANAQHYGHTAQEQAAHHWKSEVERPANRASGCGVSLGGLGHASSESGERNARSVCCSQGESDSEWLKNGSVGFRYSNAGRFVGLADLYVNGCSKRGESKPTTGGDGFVRNDGFSSRMPSSGPNNGFWKNADWLFCKDGKWRAVEPGTSPLANVTAERVGRMQPRLASLGFSEPDIKRILGRRNSTLADAGRNRVTRLKGYGNAINAEAAQVFIESSLGWLEVRNATP